jgi:hypothetical protein
MLDFGDIMNIVLEDNQDPEKEAGKAVRKLKLVPLMYKICDKLYGRFHRLYFKVSTIERTLKPENSDDDGGSSNLSNPVESVAMKANGSTATKKRKRSPLEEEKKDDE